MQSRNEIVHSLTLTQEPFHFFFGSGIVYLLLNNPQIMSNSQSRHTQSQYATVLTTNTSVNQQGKSGATD